MDDGFVVAAGYALALIGLFVLIVGTALSSLFTGRPSRRPTLRQGPRPARPLAPAATASPTAVAGSRPPAPGAVPPPSAPLLPGYAPAAPGYPAYSRAHGYAAPLPQRVHERRTAVYPNILLGVACLLVVAAAVVFASVSSSPLLRACALWAIAALAYAAGLVLHGVSRRLRPVGIALVCMGLVLVPIAGAALGGLGLTSGRIAWFVSSTAGAACFALAAYRLRSGLATWLGLLFAMSFVLSGIGLSRAPIVWYFAALIVAATVVAGLGALLRGRADTRFVLPHLVLGQGLAPATLLAALLAPDVAEQPWTWILLFGLLALHFGVSWLCLRGHWRLSAGAIALALALMAVPRGVVPEPPLDSGIAWSAVPTGVASLIGLGVALAAYLVTLLMPHSGSPKSTAFRWAFATALVIHALAAVRLWAVPDSLPDAIPLALVHTVLALGIAVTVLFIALRRDLPAARGIAVISGVLAALIAPLAVFGNREELPPSATPQILAAGLVVVLALDVAATAWTMSRHGVGKRRLRAAAGPMTPTHSAVLLLPVFVLPATDGLVFVAIALFAVLLFLCLAAFLTRNALMLIGGLPLIAAIAQCAAGGWRMTLDWTPVHSGNTGALAAIVSTALFVLVGAGLACAQLVLNRAGRYRRAAVAAAAVCVYALPFLFSTSLARAIAVPFSDRVAPPFTGGLGLTAALGIALLLAVAFAQSRAGARAPAGPTAAPVPQRRDAAGALLTARIGTGAAALLILLNGFVTWGISPLWPAIVSLVIVAAALTAFAVSRHHLAFIAALPAVFQLAFRIVARFTDDGVLTVILAAWLTWLFAYGVYWLCVGLHRPSTTSLVSAFVPAVLAIGCTPALDTHVAWLHSLPQVVAGVSTMIPALMLVLLALRFPAGTARRVVSEAATYVGAIGLMIAVHGVVDVRAAAYWHLAVAAAWLWAWLVWRRGDGAVAVNLRLILPAAVLTLVGIAASFDPGGWYSVLFLIDHVALLIFGAVRTRPWALWWGLAASVAGVLWFLRELVWLALIVLALVLIAVVVWLLLRGTGKSTRPHGAAPPPAGGPNAPPFAGPQPVPGGADRPAAPHYPVPPAPWAVPPRGPQAPPQSAPPPGYPGYPSAPVPPTPGRPGAARPAAPGHPGAPGPFTPATARQTPRQGQAPQQRPPAAVPRGNRPTAHPGAPTAGPEQTPPGGSHRPPRH